MPATAFTEFVEVNMNNRVSKGFCELCGIDQNIDFTNDVVFCTLIGIKTTDKSNNETTIGDKYNEFLRFELKNMEKYFITKLFYHIEEKDKKIIKAEFTK